jgi:D-3-phosphoglycerate dehydrogenase
MRAERADVLVVRGTAVTAAMLETGGLKLVVRAGAGLNVIDVAAAARVGIPVASCPGQNAVAVAELSLGLILALDRRIPEAVADIRAGQWHKQQFGEAQGLYGRTLGLLGWGEIASHVATRAQAFGLHLLVWSRRFATGRESPAADAIFTAVATPEELAERADILSVHLALTPETRHFVNGSLLSRLKPGSLVINTARGEIIDPLALETAVRTGHVRAGLDVFAGEPPSATGLLGSPLAPLSGVYGTPHIGGSTAQAQAAVAAETVRIITTFMRTGIVPNVVST